MLKPSIFSSARKPSFYFFFFYIFIVGLYSRQNIANNFDSLFLNASGFITIDCIQNEKYKILKRYYEFLIKS